MGCDYCVRSKLIRETDDDGGVAKIVGGQLHVNWDDRLERKGPLFMFKINRCPMCGRELGIDGSEV